MELLKNSDAYSFVDNQQRKKPWLYCFIATLFFFYEFIQMSMFNALSPSLIQAFALTASGLGNLSACYFYAMLITLLPAGLLLDHVSTKKIILTMMSVSVIGTILLSLSDSFTAAFLSRCLSGLGGAFAFQSAIRVARDNFPPSKLAFISGLIITFGMLGGVVAQTPMTLLVQHFNWHQVLWIYASLGIIFLIVISAGLPNKKPISPHKENSTEKKPALLEKIKLAVCNRHTWLGGLYTALLNLPVPVLGATWGSLYLMKTHDMSHVESSTVVSMLFFGIIIGCPLFGWCSDTLKKRRLPMLLGGFFSLIIILSIIYLPDLSKTNLMALFFILGLFSSAQTIGYSVVVGSNPRASSTALGIAALVIMGIEAMSEPFFGRVIDYYWKGQVVNHLHIYTADSFKTAILMIPIAFIIALVACFFLKEPFFMTQKNSGNKKSS
jgi:MFS family permease